MRAIAAAIAVLFFVPPAGAQFALDECKPVASLVGTSADFRDTGANVDKVVAMMRQRLAGVSASRLAAIEREIRLVFKSAVDRETVEAAVYTRCIEWLGSVKGEM